MSSRSRLLILAVFVCLCSIVSARTIRVALDGSGDYSTIQAGINAAVDGDVVVVGDDVYKGEGNRDISFWGKAITVRSENGAETCIVDCESAGRGFYFQSGEGSDSILDGVTVTNGYATDGGGIYCSSSSPTIVNCLIIGNSTVEQGDLYTGRGGGIHNFDSSPSVINCLFENNFAAMFGGGIYNRDGSNPRIERCILRANEANNRGGGIYFWRSGAEISNSIFEGNSARILGGGVHIENSNYVRIMNCLIRANRADFVAGINTQTSELDLNNCTLVDNVAKVEYGGIYSYNNVTAIANCILWNNSDSNGTEVESQVWFSGSGISSISYSCMPGVPNVGGQGNIYSNPLFMDAAGGDYGLSPESECIDRGTHDVEGGVGETDLEGKARIMDGDGDGVPVVDMGAYEYYTNQAPVSNAGEDVRVFAGADGLGMVELDGSGSSDVNGDELSYRWLLDGVEIGSGVQASVELPVGEHLVELVVFDGWDEASDTVAVIVVGPIETRIRMLPRFLNLASSGRGVWAIMDLPEGVDEGSIDWEYGVVLDPGGGGARYRRVLGSEGKWRLFALFERAKVIDALESAGNGEVTVLCRLLSGRYLYGAAEVKVIGKEG